MQCNFNTDLPNDNWQVGDMQDISFPHLKLIYTRSLCVCKLFAWSTTYEIEKQFSENFQSRCRNYADDWTDSDVEFEDKRHHDRDRSSTKSIDSNCLDSSDERSSSKQRMFSPVYFRRSIERTYYSPNYCPWSRNTSSEPENYQYPYNAQNSSSKSVSTLWSHCV